MEGQARTQAQVQKQERTLPPHREGSTLQVNNIVRIMVSKTFDESVETISSFRQGECIPAGTNVTKQNVSDYAKKESLYPHEMQEQQQDTLYQEVPILSLIGVSMDGESPIPLSSQFGFKTGESFSAQKNNEEALKYANKGESLWDIINKPEVKKSMCEEAERMFPNINPYTHKPDIDKDAIYTSYIPLVINSGAMQPQKDLSGKEYFNPEGTVMVADVFATLQSIRQDYIRKNTSVDKVAREGEYFTEGYNAIVDRMGSPFFDLYSRRELAMPVTRAELAYITVVGWKPFRGNRVLFGGKFNVGYRANWETPAKYVGKFKDAKTIRASKKTAGTDLDSGVDIMEIDLHSWKGERTLKQYLESVKRGKNALPLPMLMSMIELDALDVFYFADRELNPLREVTRGELCWFVTKISKVFATEFKSSGDNSYM